MRSVFHGKHSVSNCENPFEITTTRLTDGFHQGYKPKVPKASKKHYFLYI